MHTTQVVLGLTAIYVTHILLGDQAGLCRVVRHDGFTLLAVDPRASKLDVHAFCIDHLTVEEQNAIRRAMSEPQLGEGPMSDAVMDGQADIPLPAALRLPKPCPVAVRARATEVREQSRTTRARAASMRRVRAA